MTNVGVLKEVKDHENRVGLTPAQCGELRKAGHKVYVEADAGVGAGFPDIEYFDQGAACCFGPVSVIESADIIVKVKEPVPSEFPLLKLMPGKTLFTFLHLADNAPLARELLDNKITGVSYDTIEDELGRLPLLQPMSKIAGKFAVQFWKDDFKSKTLRRVLVVGGGVTGEAAIREAIEQDADDIVVYEKNKSRAGELEKIFSEDQVDVLSCVLLVPNEVRKADLVVGAVLVKGAKAPVVVTQQMVGVMKPGSRIVDVSIDQGGCIYGSRPTTHSEPTFELDGRVYCCIPNMPGQLPRQATEDLTALSFPHVLGMANAVTPTEYLATDAGLLKGINTHAGRLVNKTVAQALGFVK
jgi:alanine dehydrogenase